MLAIAIISCSCGTSVGVYLSDAGPSDAGSHEEDSGPGSSSGSDAGPSDAGSDAGVPSGTPALQICVPDPAPATSESCTDLSATPPIIPTLDFGPVDAMHPGSRVVTVKNIGGGILFFSPTPSTCSADEANIYSVLDQIPDDQLGPGESGSVVVAASGPFDDFHQMTAYLCIDSPIDGIGEMRVELTAHEFDDAHICFTPNDDLEFGTVDAGVSVARTVNMMNCGDDPLTIIGTAFQNEGPTTNEFALIAGTLPAAGQILAPRESIPLTFEYTAGAHPENDEAYVGCGYTTPDTDAGQTCVLSLYGTSR